MTTLRTALENEISGNIEFGEAIFTMLNRKAKRQLELIAPTQDEQVVELWRALLDIHAVQDKLGRERYRLSVLGG